MLKDEHPSEAPVSPSNAASISSSGILSMFNGFLLALMQGQFDEFDLNIFFSAKYGEKSKSETARFVYENEVQKWLDLIRGSYLPASVDDIRIIS